MDPLLDVRRGKLDHVVLLVAEPEHGGPDSQAGGLLYEAQPVRATTELPVVDHAQPGPLLERYDLAGIHLSGDPLEAGVVEPAGRVVPPGLAQPWGGRSRLPDVVGAEWCSAGAVESP